MFATRISVKAARVDAGLTQQEVADKLGISLPTYGDMERRPGRITWDEALQLSGIFNRPIEDMAFFAPEIRKEDEE